MNKPKVLFVCMGNICRSPTAHAVFRKLTREHKIDVEVDSAGTEGYHKGARPDGRSVQVGIARGYTFEKIKSRPVEKRDLDYFDYILAMDQFNIKELHKIASEEHKDKIKLFLNFSNEYEELEVPDPYYGGEKGFERVLDLIESASKGLLEELQKQVTH
ncbi:low molecular weight protein-tyrosine-phosphatase [Flocculibacter collagenilyticus]|uniref:low molecular weight protein-tyrosine-phosphatase n=1 Tax=Flocculibacter collagenilyticus TaxID=2744479 RepID=UPI0018F510C2|nr:low molecular weight protein-tyrosine-phosphatase [Flocculibacter collagenilyticus]